MSRRSMALALAVSVLLGGAVAARQTFVLQVGPPVAAMPQPGSDRVNKSPKGTLFAVRTTGCDAAGPRITGTAEGVVNGVRRSVPLPMDVLASGVHVVARGWAGGGTWVVRLAATCGAQSAGALVTLGPEDTWRREAVTLLAAPPTPAQVDAALRAAAPAGRPAESR